MRKISFLLILMLLISFQLFAEKPRIAIMDVIDESGTGNTPRVLKSLSQIMRTRIIKGGSYVVVTDNETKAALGEIRKEYNGDDYDDAFYIEVGKKVAAAKIIKTKIHFWGQKRYVISAILTDIGLEVDEAADDAVFYDDYDELEKAVNKIIGTLLESENVSAENAAFHEAMNKNSCEVWKDYLLKYKGTDEKHTSAGEKAKKEKCIIDKIGNAPLKDAKLITNSGISLIVIGTIIAAGGLAGFYIESDIEYDRYKSMSTNTAIQNAMDKGEDKATYISRANKHRDKSQLYKNLAITSGAVGGAIAITGIALTAVGVKKRNRTMQKRLSNLSVTPAGKGFFASLSFDF